MIRIQGFVWNAGGASNRYGLILFFKCSLQVQIWQMLKSSKNRSYDGLVPLHICPTCARFFSSFWCCLALFMISYGRDSRLKSKAQLNSNFQHWKFEFKCSFKLQRPLELHGTANFMWNHQWTHIFAIVFTPWWSRRGLALHMYTLFQSSCMGLGLAGKFPDSKGKRNHSPEIFVGNQFIIILLN